METKFGVNMAHLQKLYKFQRSLLKKKLKAETKMEFVNFVQCTSACYNLPAILRIYIANNRLYIGDNIVLNSRLIGERLVQGNVVVLMFRTPVPFLGGNIRLSFSNGATREAFLAVLPLDNLDDNGSSESSPDSGAENLILK